MTQDVLQKKTILKKDFLYQIGGVTLSFTLGMENSSELRSFLTCLNAAQEDLEKIIEEMKN